MARQDGREDGDERAIDRGASRGGRRSGSRPGGRRARAGCQPVWRRGSGAAGCRRSAEASAANPFAEEETGAAKASEFSDAVAVQIPSQTPTGPRKPYFIFGDDQNSVDLWYFDLARPNPQQFTGKGSGDVAPNDTGDVGGVASYDQGEWSVIFKRPLRPTAGAPFVQGEFLPIAFSVWDGFSRERGSRRGLSQWYSLYMEPEDVPSAVGPMIRTALLILVIELAVIGWVRWRKKAQALSVSRAGAGNV
jgi:hypothetical protein